MRRIGLYELREELGRGGLGQVWRAWDPGLRREVALKVLLREGWQLEPEERERFAREGEAQGRMKDPGLAEVYQLDTQANPPYLVMELVPGETLAARLRREGPLPVPEALRIGLELAGTLARLHRAGVVHRDLKPQNVILRPDGRPVLLDLGLALLLDRSARLTVSGEIMGTPGYLPPEQAEGKARDMGPAADVYGLGAVLFALLSGGPPFSGGTLQALQAVLTRPAPAPSSRRPGLPAAVDELVARCLRKEPARRPAAEELVRALERLLAGAGALTPARPRRPRAGLLLAGLVVLAGSVALVRRVGTGVGAPWPGGSTPPSVEALCAHGEALARVGLAQQAVPLLDLALARDPRHARALRWRGEARIALRQWEGALEDLDRSLDLDPQQPTGFVSRGVVQSALDRLPEAIADFGRAIALDPNSHVAHYDRAHMLAAGGDLAAALQDFDRAIALQPSGAALVDRAEARLRLGRTEEAEQDLDRALELEPDLVRALILRSGLRARLGRCAEAEADCERALGLAPGHAPAHLAYANVLGAGARFEEALPALDEALRLDPDSASAHLQRGWVLGQLQRWEDSIRSSTRAMELDPELAAAALYNRATALRATDRLIDALKDLDELVRLGPGDPRGFYQRGMLRAALRDYRGAFLDFDRALELSPDATWAAEVRSARDRAAAALAPR